MAKRSIDFTKERMEKVERLMKLMGIGGTHGEIPKTLDLGVTLALEYIDFLAEVTPDLSDPKFAFLIPTIQNRQKELKPQPPAADLPNLREK